jgi:hypothetical protein
VQKSFEGWVARLGSHLIDPSIEKFSFWRNCCCMFKVAHTLLEVGAVDLQMFAGKDVIEGVRMRPLDYAKLQQKIRKWAKQDFALVGVSCKFNFHIRTRQRLTLDTFRCPEIY